MSTNPIDTYNFRQMIIDSPNQFEVGMSLAKGIRVPGTFASVMISGMGGSALPGGLLRAYIADVLRDRPQEFMLYENRSYRIPKHGTRDTLHIISSYSGNTEETIASFEDALAKGLPCIGFSSGGKLQELCQANGVPHVILPIPMPGFQPRIGTGYFFGALAQILVNQGLLPDTLDVLRSETEDLTAALSVVEEKGRVLGESLKGKTPVVYASDPYDAVAMVWKIKLNENAKVPAFWNVFPEVNHNEMVGFTHPQASFCVIMLRDPGASKRILARYTATKNLLEKQGIEVVVIDLATKSVFFTMFESILLADFTSYYLALSYNQDPAPVPMVEELKKMLQSHAP